MKKIAFFVMTKKGYEVLKEVESQFPSSIDLIISIKDKNVKIDFFDQIKTFAIKKSIKFYDYKKFKFKIDNFYIFAISWKYLITNFKNSQLIVLHDSLLPKYRGFNPLVSALINGEKKIGVSAIKANHDYDNGDIIKQKKIIIKYPIKIQQVIDLIIPIYKDLVINIIKTIKKNKLLYSKKQNNKKATYSLWRDEEDYLINWNDSSQNIKRFIDASGYPYKGASTFFENKKIRINNAEIMKEKIIVNRTPGKIFKNDKEGYLVVCKKGIIKISDIYYDKNKKKLNYNKIKIKFA